MKFLSRILLVLAALAIPNTLLAVVAWLSEMYLWTIVLGAFAVLGAVFSCLVAGEFHSKIGAEIENVTQLKKFNFDIFSHVISYIPSLIAFNIDLNAEGIGLLVFYAFYIFLLAISDVVILNPLLFIFGWKFNAAVITFAKGSEEVVIVTKPGQGLKLGDSKLIKLTNFGVYLLQDE